MASVHSCCKGSPGQILSLPLSSMALIPLASGHLQACRKKSPPHHWRHADPHHTPSAPPPLTAKINCTPSLRIVSPSVSLSGALSSSARGLFKISANEIAASAQFKTTDILVFWAKSCRGLIVHLAVLCSLFCPPLCSNKFSMIDLEGMSRARRGHTQAQVGFDAAFFGPLRCPEQSSSITRSSMQLFQNGCLCVSVRLVSEDWRKYVLRWMHTD